jgi:tetratricopeptide (TPR) repeat protein
MKIHPLFIALFFFFVSSFYLFYMQIDSETQTDEKQEKLLRPVFSYLTEGKSRFDFHRILKEQKLFLTRDFWDAFKFMDETIVNQDLKKAIQVRQRFSEMSEFIANYLKLGGFSALSSQHADIVEVGSHKPILDPDLERAGRRLLAMKALECFWRGDSKQGFKICAEIPDLPVSKMQAIEVALALRQRREKLREAHGQISQEDAFDTWKFIKWSQNHHSVIVLAENAFLLEEIFLSGIFNPEQSNDHVRQILETGKKALAGQACQRNELLSLLLRVSQWSENSSKELFDQVCDYVISLGELSGEKLFKECLLAYHRKRKGNLAKSYLLDILEKKRDARYGVALHLKALVMQEKLKDQPEKFKTVLKVFEEAFNNIKSPQLKADLYVDIGLYKHDLSKKVKKNGRIFFREAIAHFRQALKYDVHHVPARLNLATFSLKVNNVKNARTWMEPLDLRRASRHQKAVGNWVWAQIHLKEGNLEEARYRIKLAEQYEPFLPGLTIVKKQIGLP